MIEQTSEALRAWFKRVEPYYPELFNTAHAICGNYDQAEYALRSAILEVWSQNAESAMGFREKLRSALREEALAVSDEAGPAEFTWPGFPADSVDGLLQQASRERIEVQRALMLKYGVGLPTKRIARLTGMTPSQLRAALDRFESRCRRALSGQERARFGALFAHAARQCLVSRTGIPHPAGVYRAFEAEASSVQLSDHRVSRMVYRALILGLAVMCAALFWLFAVLVYTPVIKADPVPVTALTDTPGPWDTPAPDIETTHQTEAPV